MPKIEKKMYLCYMWFPTNYPWQQSNYFSMTCIQWLPDAVLAILVHLALRGSEHIRWVAISILSPRRCCLLFSNDSPMKTQEGARRALGLRSMHLCPTTSQVLTSALTSLNPLFSSDSLSSLPPPLMYLNAVSSSAASQQSINTGNATHL